MKKLNFINFVYLFSILTVLAVVISCNPIKNDNDKDNSDLSLKNESLFIANKRLNNTIIAKDSTIKSILFAFSSIQSNLIEIQEKQAEIRNSKKETNASKNKSRLIDRLKSIEDLNRQNKETMITLKESLNESFSNDSSDYNNFIKNLDFVVLKKDSQVTAMRNLLESNNYKVEVLEQMYFDIMVDADEKSKKLNTAYYTAGTTKQLLEKGVITKQGGFIGIGASQKLSDKFNQVNFQELNIKQFKKVKFKTKKIKLVTTHPINSYEIKKENEECVLSILIPEKFWSASKYMVVLLQ